MPGEEHHVAAPRCMRGNFQGALDHSGAFNGHAAGDCFSIFSAPRDQQRKNGLLTQWLCSAV